MEWLNHNLKLLALDLCEQYSPWITSLKQCRKCKQLKAASHSYNAKYFLWTSFKVNGSIPALDSISTRIIGSKIHFPSKAKIEFVAWLEKGLDGRFSWGIFPEVYKDILPRIPPRKYPHTVKSGIEGKVVLIKKWLFCREKEGRQVGWW